MWSINEPTCSVTEIVIACSKSVLDPDLRTRVAASAADMAANTSILRSFAASDRMHEMSSADVPVVRLSSSELRGLYTRQLARIGSKARIFYEEILGGAKHGLCSYCRYGQADSLDHFVPKATVPELSVEPFNLVPSCSRCNHKLGSGYSSEPGLQMLHPYLEFDLGRWLRARVDEAADGVVRFYADPADALPEDLRGRIIAQFGLLGLSELYSVVSAQELSGLRKVLTDNFSSADPLAISAHLADVSAAAFRGDDNDRRGVMYEALADSEWYCAGGYETVGC